MAEHYYAGFNAY